MTLDARVQLRKDVMAAEGFRSHPYQDTAGKLTIGYGRNLDSVGLSILEAEVLLDHDLANAEQECIKAFDPWFRDLNDARQRVIVEMTLNLGLSRLFGFGRMLNAVKGRHFAAAADEMLKSKWATQVGARAVRLAEAMRTGK